MAKLPPPGPTDRKAFTVRFPGLVQVIMTPVFVAEHDRRQSAQRQLPESESVMAIWDTGASHSAISKRLATKLGLVPTNKRRITGVHGTNLCNAFYVDIYLPNRTYLSLEVTEVDGLVGPADVLIGMDIIAIGDFAISRDDGKSIVTWQIPSTHCFDFTDEVEQERRKIAQKAQQNRRSVAPPKKRRH